MNISRVYFLLIHRMQNLSFPKNICGLRGTEIGYFDFDLWVKVGTTSRSTCFFIWKHTFCISETNRMGNFTFRFTLCARINTSSKYNFKLKTFDNIHINILTHIQIIYIIYLIVNFMVPFISYIKNVSFHKNKICWPLDSCSPDKVEDVDLCPTMSPTIFVWNIFDLIASRTIISGGRLTSGIAEHCWNFLEYLSLLQIIIEYFIYESKETIFLQYFSSYIYIWRNLFQI